MLGLTIFCNLGDPENHGSDKSMPIKVYKTIKRHTKIEKITNREKSNKSTRNVLQQIR